MLSLVLGAVAARPVRCRVRGRAGRDEPGGVARAAAAARKRGPGDARFDRRGDPTGDGRRGARRAGARRAARDLAGPDPLYRRGRVDVLWALVAGGAARDGGLAGV